MFAKLLGPCLIGGLMLGVVQPASAQRGNPVVQFEGQTIDEMIGAFMKEHDVPGMTLAIVQAPYISRVVGYGTSDVEKRLLASPKTLWNAGQLTQAYTAVAIMQLVEAEKLAHQLDGQHFAVVKQRGGPALTDVAQLQPGQLVVYQAEDRQDKIVQGHDAPPSSEAVVSIASDEGTS